MYLESIGIDLPSGGSCNVENPVVRDELWRGSYGGSYNSDDEKYYVKIEYSVAGLSAEKERQFERAIRFASIEAYYDGEEDTGERLIEGWLSDSELDTLLAAFRKYGIHFEDLADA